MGPECAQILGGSRGVGVRGIWGLEVFSKYGVLRSKDNMRYKGYQGFRVCSGLLGLGVFWGLGVFGV